MNIIRYIKEYRLKLIRYSQRDVFQCFISAIRSPPHRPFPLQWLSVVTPWLRWRRIDYQFTHGIRETVYVDGFGRIHFGSLPLTSLSFDGTTLNSRLIFLFFFIKSDVKIINLCVADSSMISVEGLHDDHLRTSLYYNFTKI